MNNPWTKNKNEVLEKLQINPEVGLSTKEVLAREKQFGLNKLPEEKPLSAFLVFLEQFKSPLIYILVIAGIITFILKELTDSVVIFGAVFLNAVVGFFQEYKASKALSSLKKVLKIKAIVLRNGNEKEVPQEELVPGDIILLKQGDKVPADARLIETQDLKVNESVLTGEWLPAEKKISKLDPNTPLADRDNMVYMGTMVEDGRGKAVVIETGETTEIGKIARMVKEAKEEKTPYQKKLARFSEIVSWVLVVICVLIFIEGMLTGGEFVEMFTTSVAVAVAAIPEGLPVAMTVILALGMQRILKRKGLTRKLSSAETLGSTSVILTDKTGTLTEAKMKVAGVFPENLSQFALKIATLTNEAFVENPDDPLEKWVIRGESTEKALLSAAIEAGIFKSITKEKENEIESISFNPVNKYSVSLHQSALYIKGAPEKILSMSKYFEINGKQEKLTPQKLKELKEKYEELAAKGQRVLAVGYKKVRGSRFEVRGSDFDDLVFVSFVSLHDPLRSETKEAIKTCFKGGLKPIIATGDHKLTAKAIAQELGLPTGKGNIIEGKGLDKMSEAELQKRLSEIDVYARVEPAQKLRIVEAWQKRGKVVAMTGDGINDTPALKKADIGVALGSGTEVAKEVADLVLLQDNFSVIVAAIEEGRAIVDNIRKVVAYLFSSSFTEIFLIGVGLFLGWPLPIIGVQILWVNLIEDGPLGLCLAFEPKEKDLMKQKPQSIYTPLLTKEMKVLIFIIGLVNILLLLALFSWLSKNNHQIAHIRTMVFACLTIDSLFYVFSCKSLRQNLWHINPFSNKFLVASWFIGIIMLVSALYLPIFQTLLKTVPLNFNDWLIILGLGAVNLILIEATKWYFIAKRQTT